MNEFVTSSAEPSYLMPLALTVAPFGPTDDPQFFFKSEQIEQRINLLLHLIRSSDKVALLFADHGFGKSALLMQLQHTLGDDVRICRIDVEPSTEPEVLLLHCLRTLGVDDNEIRLSSDHAELLRQRCQSLQNLNVKPLLLIDNAHQLSTQSLAMILNCLSWQQQQQFLVQAVLTAKHAMPELNTIHGRIQRIDYYPIITETELAAYLMHRLMAAGYQDDLPFKEKIIRQIFKKSGGQPELINQLAHQQLLGIKSLSASKKTDLSTLLKWLSIGLLVILLALLLAFQDKLNLLFNTTKMQPEPDQLWEVIPEQQVTPIMVDPEVDTGEIQPAEDLENLLGSPPPSAGMAMANEEIAVDLAEEQGRAELQALIAELAVITSQQATLASPEAKDIMSTDSDNKVRINTASQISSTTTYHRRQWILQQDANHFTFQLMGSWDQVSVTDFIDKYKLMGDVAIFESDRSGQTWYALVYGVFESKEIAQQASNNWSEPLKGLPKWLRPFESVQQQIQQ